MFDGKDILILLLLIGFLISVILLKVTQEKQPIMCNLQASGNLDLNNSMLATISMNKATITNIQLTFPCKMMGYGYD